MNRKVFIRHGAFLMIAAIVFACVETRNFGNNLVPGTVAEAVTDLCALFMLLTGAVLYTIGQALPKE